MQQQQQELDREFEADEIAGTLEGKAMHLVIEGLRLVKDGEPSDVLKFMTEIVQQTMAMQALRATSIDKRDKNTGQSYQAWHELDAANSLGCTHKQLQGFINKFGLMAPEPPNPQTVLDFPAR